MQSKEKPRPQLQLSVQPHAPSSKLHSIEPKRGLLLKVDQPRLQRQRQPVL
jgi:hypothetical protein